MSRHELSEAELNKLFILIRCYASGRVHTPINIKLKPKDFWVVCASLSSFSFPFVISDVDTHRFVTLRLIGFTSSLYCIRTCFQCGIFFLDECLCNFDKPWLYVPAHHRSELTSMD